MVRAPGQWAAIRARAAGGTSATSPASIASPAISTDTALSASRPLSTARLARAVGSSASTASP